MLGLQAHTITPSLCHPQPGSQGFLHALQELLSNEPHLQPLTWILELHFWGAGTEQKSGVSRSHPSWNPGSCVSSVQLSLRFLRPLSSLSLEGSVPGSSLVTFCRSKLDVPESEPRGNDMGENTASDTQSQRSLRPEGTVCHGQEAGRQQVPQLPHPRVGSPSVQTE